MPTRRRLAGALTAALVLAAVLASVAAVGVPPVAAAARAPGQISTLAGTIGEGVATSIAQRPRSIAARGTKVYVGSESNYVVRELDTETGLQRVIAGNGRDERSDPATRGESGSAQRRPSAPSRRWPSMRPGTSTPPTRPASMSGRSPPRG
jgi:hypothetical protein